MERQEEEGGGWRWGWHREERTIHKNPFFVYLVWLLLYLTAVCDELECILHSS